MAFKKAVSNVLGLIFLSLITSVLIIISFFSLTSKLTEKPVKRVQEKPLADTGTEIDAPEDIDLSFFAPFYYWKETAENETTLSLYGKDGKKTDFPSIKSRPDSQSGIKTENYVSEIKPGNNLEKIALIRTGKLQGKLDDTIQIYNANKNTYKDYSVSPEIYDFGNHTLNFSSWSPDDRYLYFLYSSESESDHNIWLIDTNLETSKILLKGYDINVIGWINERTVAYYINPRKFGGDLDILSMDVRSGSTEKIGYCSNVWLNQCLFSRKSMPEDNLLFSDTGNNTKIMVYNYKYQTGKELTDVLDNVEFGRATIIGFSPDKAYMYFSIYQSHTNRQPKESGTYEYNLHGDYWRHITDKELTIVAWDKISQGTEVLFKEEGQEKYYLHPVESFEMHPTKLPDEIFRIVN